jgi:hypothetical protein
MGGLEMFESLVYRLCLGLKCRASLDGTVATVDLRFKLAIVTAVYLPEK